MTENERALLGQMILDDKIYYEAGLIVEDFVSTDGKAVFTGIKKIIDDGHAPDLINVSQMVPSGIISAADVAKLTDVPTTQNWKHYRDQVIEAGTKHRAVQMVKIAAERAEQYDSKEFLERLQQGIDKIAQRQMRYDIRSTKECVVEFTEGVEKAYRKGGVIPGIPTGFPGVDSLIHGFQDETFYVIGGRPSEGKSVTLKDFAVNTGMEGYASGFITTESPWKQLVNRVYAGMTRINSRDLISGNFPEKGFKKLNEASAALYDAPIYIYDEPNATLQTVMLIARRMVKYYGVKILYIDYLQNIKYYQRGMPKNLQVAHISSQLKQLSRELKVPVVAAAQLTRPKEKDRVPMISDLAWAGEIEQDADTIMLLHHVYINGTDEIEKSEFLFRKNRDGARGKVDVVFDAPHTSFIQKGYEYVEPELQGELI